MVTVNINEAESNFPLLLAQVEAGEEVVIARDGAPIARIVREQPSERPLGKRKPGRWKGKIKIDDSFFEPLPEEELALWEGSADDE